MSLVDSISSDPAICRGQACVKGTRIPVSVVLGALADGMTEAEILTLDRDFADVREYPPDTRPGIIVVRVDPPQPSWVKGARTGLLAHHDLEYLRGCLVIAQLGTARIRRPPPKGGAAW